MAQDTFDWDAVKVGDYFKWTTVGQRVVGRIVRISSHTFDAKGKPGEPGSTPEKTVPVLTVATDAGAEIDLTCSNADLLAQLKEKKPGVGDRIDVEYLRDVPTSFGGKKLLFMVRVEKGTAAAPAPVEQGEPPF